MEYRHVSSRVLKMLYKFSLYMISKKKKKSLYIYGRWSDGHRLQFQYFMIFFCSLFIHIWWLIHYFSWLDLNLNFGFSMSHFENLRFYYKCSLLTNFKTIINTCLVIRACGEIFFLAKKKVFLFRESNL